MANVADGHFDLDMCDDEVLADGPNVYGTLVEGPSRGSSSASGSESNGLRMSSTLLRCVDVTRLDCPLGSSQHTPTCRSVLVGWVFGSVVLCARSVRVGETQISSWVRFASGGPERLGASWSDEACLPVPDGSQPCRSCSRSAREAIGVA
jgi:hypothetical protein